MLPNSLKSNTGRRSNFKALDHTALCSVVHLLGNMSCNRKHITLQLGQSQRRSDISFHKHTDEHGCSFKVSENRHPSDIERPT